MYELRLVCSYVLWATRFTNETRLFFEDDGTTLWITFVGERLYWGLNARLNHTTMLSGVIGPPRSRTRNPTDAQLERQDRPL
jgi:hypothetical protein